MPFPYNSAAGAYMFNATDFWPIDNQLLGNAPGAAHNCHFTLQVQLCWWCNTAWCCTGCHA